MDALERGLCSGIGNDTGAFGQRRHREINPLGRAGPDDREEGVAVLAVAAPRPYPLPSKLDTRHSSLFHTSHFPFPPSLCYTFPRGPGQGRQAPQPAPLTTTRPAPYENHRHPQERQMRELSSPTARVSETYKGPTWFLGTAKTQARHTCAEPWAASPTPGAPSSPRPNAKPGTPKPPPSKAANASANPAHSSARCTPRDRHCPRPHRPRPPLDTTRTRHLRPQPRRPTHHHQHRHRPSTPAERHRPRYRSHHGLWPSPMQRRSKQAPQRLLPWTTARPGKRPERYYRPLCCPVWRTPPRPTHLHSDAPAARRLGRLRQRDQRDRPPRSVRAGRQCRSSFNVKTPYAQGMHKGCARELARQLQARPKPVRSQKQPPRPPLPPPPIRPVSPLRPIPSAPEKPPEAGSSGG